MNLPHHCTYLFRSFCNATTRCPFVFALSGSSDAPPAASRDIGEIFRRALATKAGGPQTIGSMKIRGRAICYRPLAPELKKGRSGATIQRRRDPDSRFCKISQPKIVANRLCVGWRRDNTPSIIFECGRIYWLRKMKLVGQSDHPVTPCCSALHHHIGAYWPVILAIAVVIVICAPKVGSHHQQNPIGETGLLSLVPKEIQSVSQMSKQRFADGVVIIVRIKSTQRQVCR